MTKAEELNLFLVRADEFIDGKYILADIKIVNLLKSIAYSKTLLAIFETCLKDFDYATAKKKYLVKNKFLSEDKGEFVLPSNSKELLAFTFLVLMDVDSHKIDLNEFINKYFYVDGSFSSGYTKFLNDMIKPFKASVKNLMEDVIKGVVQDPIEALTQREEEDARLKAQLEKEQKQKESLAKKNYFDSIEKICKMLLADKTKINAKVKNESKKAEFILIIDMFANALYSEDKDAISYSYLAYKYMVKANPLKFFGRNNQISKLITDVYNGL